MKDIDILDKIYEKTEDTKEKVDAVDHKLDMHISKSSAEIKRANDTQERFGKTFAAHVQDDRDANNRYIALLGKISEQVEESNQFISKLDKKMDLSIQKLQSEVEAINRLDEVQNEQLRIHIKGTNTNTARLELQRTEMNELLNILRTEMKDRLAKLEEPRKVMNLLKKWILSAGAIAGAVYAIMKAINHFGL